MRRHSDLLERCAGKLASTVLRGEGDSNVLALPDYWSSRMGKNPDLPSRVSILLKWQKGKCSHCEFIFKNEDVMEVDHIVPRAIGGNTNFLKPCYR
jgi:5-methylcytosine-specific restriction endonuclease McrA